MSREMTLIPPRTIPTNETSRAFLLRERSESTGDGEDDGAEAVVEDG